MKRQTSYIFGIALFFSLWMSPILAQTGVIQGHSFLGGVSATTQGLNSTNYLNGIVPSATVTVYLTGTHTLATIYSSSTGTPLANPFTSNTVGSVNPGGWIFWAATAQGYDIVFSGGIPPNVYVKPVTLTDVFPGAAGGGGGGCTPISSGGNCVTNDPTVTQNIVQPNSTQFGYGDPNGNGTTFTASATSPLIYSQASRDGSFTHSDNWVSASITPFSQLGQAGFDILTYPEASTTYNPAFQHQYDFDNNGAYFYTDSFQVQTDPGGDITFNPGIQSTGPGSTTASSSIELGGNITVAGGNNGTCGSGGNFCTTTTMSWTNNSYGAGYNTISLNASSGAFTVTLPPAAGPSAPLDTILWFFKADATTNAITLAAASGDTVNGLSSISLSTPYQLIQLTSNGTHSWYVMGMGGSGSSGISGLTANYIPLAGSATTITADSHLDDGVTTAGTITSTEPIAVAVTGGQGGTFDATEGTAAAAAAGHDILYASSANHCLEYSANGGAFACLGSGGGSGFPITLGSTSIASGSTTTTIAGLTLTSPTLTTPALGTPASGVATNITGLVPGNLVAGSIAAQLTFPGGDNFNGGVNAQTGTTYTMVAGDENKTLTLSNASAVAVTLPQATTTGFTAGAFFHVVNLGAGTVTITPTTSTINGATTLALTTDQGADIYSDGTNYTANLGAASGGGGGIANIQVTTTTSAVSATSCEATAHTATMTGLATTSSVKFTPTADTSGATGWGASAGLFIDAWPSAGTLNWKVCNPTSSSITPGSVTWNVSAQ